MGRSVEQQTQQRQLVIFELAGESYGVDIHRVREIIRVPAITRVPRTPEFIEGVINLRGGVTPVLDLRKRFGFAEGTDYEQRRIVIVEADDQTIGMIVDAVNEVVTIDAAQIDPPSPYIVSIDTEYIGGVAKIAERLVILLELDRVLSTDEKARLADLPAGDVDQAAAALDPDGDAAEQNEDAAAGADRNATDA